MRNDLYVSNVVVHYGYAGNNHYGWSAKMNWQGGDFCQSGYAEGTIQTRYYEETLSKAIGVVLDIKETFGLQESPLGLALLYEMDGEDLDFPPPMDFKEKLAKEAEKRKWKTYGNLV